MSTGKQGKKEKKSARRRDDLFAIWKIQENVNILLSEEKLKQLLSIWIVTGSYDPRLLQVTKAHVNRKSMCPS